MYLKIDANSEYRQYRGYSSEQKPTSPSGVAEGDVFYEMDTQKEFVFDGEKWTENKNITSKDLKNFATKEDISELVSKKEFLSTPLNPPEIHKGEYASLFGPCTVSPKNDGSVDVTRTQKDWNGPFFNIQINPAVENTLTFTYKNLVTDSAETKTGSVYIKMPAYKNIGTFMLTETSSGVYQYIYKISPELIKELQLTSTICIGLTSTFIESCNVSVINSYGDSSSIASILHDVSSLKSGRCLEGKKVLFLGDSITALSNGWVAPFVELTGCIKIANVAVSSAILPDKQTTVYDGDPKMGVPDNNTLGNQVQKIINNAYEAPDLIMIAIGTNSGITASDSSVKATYINSDNEMVALEDLDKTRSEGAFRYCNETLHNLYPNAVICWCNPIPGAKSSREVHKIVEWANALKLLTAYGSVHNIETNRCGIFMANEIKGANGESLVDGLHPNANGAMKIAKFNAAAVSSFMI